MVMASEPRGGALGHVVSVANARGPETLRDLAAETGAAAVSVTDAARDKDLGIVTPEKNIPDLPDDLFAGTGDVVIQNDGQQSSRQSGCSTDNPRPPRRGAARPAAFRDRRAVPWRRHFAGVPGKGVTVVPGDSRNCRGDQGDCVP